MLCHKTHIYAGRRGTWKNSGASVVLNVYGWITAWIQRSTYVNFSNVQVNESGLHKRIDKYWTKPNPLFWRSWWTKGTVNKTRIATQGLRTLLCFPSSPRGSWEENGGGGGYVALIETFTLQIHEEKGRTTWQIFWNFLLQGRCFSSKYPCDPCSICFPHFSRCPGSRPSFGPSLSFTAPTVLSASGAHESEAAPQNICHVVWSRMVYFHVW